MGGVSDVALSECVTFLFWYGQYEAGEVKKDIKNDDFSTDFALSLGSEQNHDPAWRGSIDGHLKVI